MNTPLALVQNAKMGNSSFCAPKKLVNVLWVAQTISTANATPHIRFLKLA